jgi:hypothetical protein
MSGARIEVLDHGSVDRFEFAKDIADCQPLRCGQLRAGHAMTIDTQSVLRAEVGQCPGLRAGRAQVRMAARDRIVRNNDAASGIAPNQDIGVVCEHAHDHRFARNMHAELRRHRCAAQGEPFKRSSAKRRLPV